MLLESESLFVYELPRIPQIHEHLRLWKRALLDCFGTNATEKYILRRSRPKAGYVPRLTHAVVQNESVLQIQREPDKVEGIKVIVEKKLDSW